MIVEVAGAPGAGKSTLVPAVLEGCRDAGFTSFLVEDAARSLVLRTPVGRLLARVSPRAGATVAWPLYVVYRGTYAAGHLLGNPPLARHLWASQRRRPADADARRREVTRWYLRMVGARAFLAAHVGPDEVVVIDEGYVHRVVQLHTSRVERASAATVARYAAVLTPPDLVIHVAAPPEIAVDRVAARGTWARWSGRCADEVATFVANAHDAVAQLVVAVASDGVAVLRVDNAADGPELAAKQLAEDVADFLGGTRRPVASIGALRAVRRPAHWRPRRASITAPPFDDSTLAAVIGSFGIDPEVETRALSAGWRNDLVRVGAAGGPLVLKRYAAQWTAGAVDHEHAVLAELARTGFPAPRVHATPEGATRVEHNGRQFALFGWIDGANPSRLALPPATRRRLVAAAGELLGRLHADVAGFEPTGAHHLGGENRTLAWYRDALGRLSTRPQAKSGREAELRRRATAIGDRLAAIDAELGGRPLPDTVIHGDYGLHNLLVTTRGRISVVDFELARVERRLVDVAAAAARLRVGDRELLLAGYRRANPLPDDEWAVVDLVLEEYRLRGAVRSWDNFTRYGSPRRLDTALARLDAAATRERWR